VDVQMNEGGGHGRSLPNPGPVGSKIRLRPVSGGC